MTLKDIKEKISGQLKFIRNHLPLIEDISFSFHLNIYIAFEFLHIQIVNIPFFK